MNRDSYENQNHWCGSECEPLAAIGVGLEAVYDRFEIESKKFE